MPNTPRLNWPYPRENTDPWFEAFVALVEAIDASTHASHENSQTILMGGGTVTFNTSTGQLAWSAAFEFTSPYTGFLHTLAAGNVTVADGEMAYVPLTRSLTANETVTAAAAAAKPGGTSFDEFFVLGVRRGTKFYFRNGRVLPQNYLLLFSPNGTKYVLTVDNAGSLSVGTTEP